MNIPHNRSANEDVLDAAQVWILELIEDYDIVKFDVEILVDGFEGAANGDVVLEFDCHGVVRQGLEEAEACQSNCLSRLRCGLESHCYLKKSIVVDRQMREYLLMLQ